MSYFDLHLSRHASTHVNLLFSQHLYVRGGPSVSDEFLLEEHFEREMQLKKFTTRRKLAPFFFFPLSRATFTSGYSERERSLGLRATDHSQLHPLHEMHSHTHTHTHRAISHTAPTRAREVSPPTGQTHFRNWMFESGWPTFDHM